ncbi:MAG: HAD hydrolase family protein [Lachnospiraceae bacterium]|nr:HAD hydrolase family protein [Lachnospiraceae bacterium]
MSYKGLIGLDLDGTIYNDNKEITKNVMDAIKNAVKQGYVVFPATGRPLNGVPEDILEIEGVDFILCANGASIYANVAVLDRLDLSKVSDSIDIIKLKEEALGMAESADDNKDSGKKEVLTDKDKLSDEFGKSVSLNGSGIKVLSGNSRIINIAGKTFVRIYEDYLDSDKVVEVLTILDDFVCVPDCFVEGSGRMPEFGKELIPKLGLAPAMQKYILSRRTYYPDLKEYVKSLDKTGEMVEKITVNFYLNDAGIKEKQAAYESVMKVKDIKVVSGAPHNIEVNTANCDKGEGILKLCELLKVSPDKTCAVGDDINDYDMVKKAHFGIAMGNAVQEVKDIADFITKSNEEDGVKYAIERFIG